MSRFTLATPPQPAGFFVLWEGFKVGAYRRPSLAHRIAVRVLLGWKWEPSA